jgi:hypothetical protein
LAEGIAKVRTLLLEHQQLCLASLSVILSRICPVYLFLHVEDF